MPLLAEAAEQGDVEAMNSLGVLFVTNARVASDYSMALYWFQPMRLSANLARGRASQDLVAACACLEVAALFELDGQLQVVVLARMEDLGDRLGPVKWDEGRSRAARTVADIRARAAREPSPQVSPASTRRLASA